MKTPRVALLLVLLASSDAYGHPADELALASPSRLTTADRRLMESVLRETRVVTTPTTPGWRAYPATLAEALARWLGERVPSLRPLLSRFQSVARPLAWIVIIVAIALVLFLAARALTPLLRRTRAGREGDGSLIEHRDESRTVARTREGLIAALERHLQRGDVSRALEAAWWLLAHSLLADRVDPAWTSGEVLCLAGRKDLAPLATILDRMLYASRPPMVPEVRDFYTRVRAEVG